MARVRSCACLDLGAADIRAQLLLSDVIRFMRTADFLYEGV